MSHGYAKRPEVIDVAGGDTHSIDAFGRWRVSSPTYVFDHQLTYSLGPLIYEPITNGSGATVTHDSTNRMALMTFSGTATGGKAYMQTFEHFRYQPGRSQLILLTFNFIETKANCLKFVGYSDGTNGIELQQNGSTVQFSILTNTSRGTETVAQADWNLDKMNGAGPSGVTLDLTKVQILVIDLQALYVGRVRVGFDIHGDIFYVHEFLHANVDTSPYIQTANLPVRAGMTCSGTVSTTMNFVCASISSGGGQEDVGGYSFSVEGTNSSGNTVRAHLLSVRPKTTFNSITNRTKFVLDSVDIIVTGNSPILWELCIGQALTTPTFADVNATYSGFQSVAAATLSGNPGIVIAQGYVASSAATKSAVSAKVSNKYPITLDAAGAVRDFGTLTLLGTGLSAASVTRATFNWHEIR